MRDLCLIIVAALFTSAASGPESLSWSRVESLTPNTRVLVSIAPAGSLRGTFVTAGADSLTVRSETGVAATLQRRDVMQVAVVGSWAKRSALIAGGAFVAIGAVNKASLESIMLIAGLQAGFWALVGRNFETQRVIYRAP